MKRMSFALTSHQYREGSKTVTRRLGWKNLKPGDPFMGIEKGMGLKKGEKQVELGLSICFSNHAEPLSEMIINSGYGRRECIREGFPNLSPQEFVEFFCKANKCTPSKIVNRIQFQRL